MLEVENGDDIKNAFALVRRLSILYLAPTKIHNSLEIFAVARAAIRRKFLSKIERVSHRCSQNTAGPCDISGADQFWTNVTHARHGKSVSLSRERAPVNSWGRLIRYGENARDTTWKANIAMQWCDKKMSISGSSKQLTNDKLINDWALGAFGWFRSAEKVSRRAVICRLIVKIKGDGTTNFCTTHS